MSLVQDMLSPLPDISPEKLTILKLKHSTLNRDVFSEPSSPIHEHEGMNFSKSSGNMSSSSFLHSHRSEMSRELTSQVCLICLSGDHC